MMIYIWLYLILGAFVIGAAIYWDCKHNEHFYIKDIWKILLTWLAWPVMTVFWLWFYLDEKYQISEKLDGIGDKKLF